MTNPTDLAEDLDARVEAEIGQLAEYGNATRARLESMGAALRRAREAASMSAEVLAERAGLGVDKLLRIEDGRQFLTFDLLGRYVDGLGQPFTFEITPLPEHLAGLTSDAEDVPQP